jgi:hypothetical protein
MAGPFDNFFGGGGAAAGNMFGGNMYGDLLTPEQLAAVRRQSMMQVAAKLLESSGPSTTRRTLGQTLGGALSAGAEAMQTGQTNAVQQMLLKQKLDEGKLEREQNERIRKMIGGGDATIDTINAPVETAGRVGPTMQRAAMPTTAVNPLMVGLTDQQRAILQVTPTSKVPDVLAGFQKDASAMSEVTGQPFEVTDATGRPIMVQQTKGGKITTLEGFGPKREIVLENLGGRTVAIDKKSLKGGESFQREMTPGEVASNRVALGNLGVAQANLSLSRERFKSEGYTVQDSDQGKVYVPRDPTKPSIPVLGPSGSQLKARVDPPADFMKSAKKLQDMEGTLKDFKDELAKDLTVFPPEIPLPFGAKIPLPTGKDTATVKAKYNALLMGVKDLYELGALTGPDMAIVEQQLTNPASFSGIFTSRPAMNQQVQVLEDMLARSKQNLSTTYNRPIPGKNITVDY